MDPSRAPRLGGPDAPPDEATLVDPADDSPAWTPPTPPPPPGEGASRHVRVFGSHAFFRLWLVQVVSGFGDWLGFLAIITIAADLGGEDAGAAAAISLVLIPRILPGLFLASVGGVIVDRLHRTRLMVACDVGRAALLLMVAGVDGLLALVVLSFFIEIATSLWSPAKEAIVPNITPSSHLASANSLNLVAAYGTAPVAAIAFAGLSRLADSLSGRFSALEWLDGPRLALFVDAGTFLFSAALVATLPVVARPRSVRRRRRDVDLAGPWRDLREGWRYILGHPIVRAVILGLGTGMIGGGMLIPLGELFADEVLGGGDAAFGLLLFALGLGVAIGVVTLGAAQRRISPEPTFVLAVVSAGVCLVLAASMSALAPAVVLVVGLGVAAGGVYVLGFTVLHHTVADELRGRVFAALYVVVRFCVLIAIGLGPLLASVADVVTDRYLDGEIELLGVAVAVPGVRVALWAAGALIVVSGLLAASSFRRAGAVDLRLRSAASR